MGNIRLTIDHNMLISLHLYICMHLQFHNILILPVYICTFFLLFFFIHIYYFFFSYIYRCTFFLCIHEFTNMNDR